jgi:hypothetical protein
LEVRGMSTDPVPLRGGDPPVPDPETINVIYDRLSNVAELQFGDQANLDGKMIQVFSAASVVMGLTGLSASAATKNPAVVAALLALALAVYAAVAVVTGVEIWARQFKALRFGATLWDYEWDQTPMQVKMAVIDKVKGAYDTNRIILEQKGKLLTAGIVATGCEVALVAASIIVRVTSN